MRPLAALLLLGCATASARPGASAQVDSCWPCGEAMCCRVLEKSCGEVLRIETIERTCLEVEEPTSGRR